MRKARCQRLSHPAESLEPFVQVRRENDRRSSTPATNSNVVVNDVVFLTCRRLTAKRCHRSCLQFGENSEEQDRFECLYCDIRMGKMGVARGSWSYTVGFVAGKKDFSAASDVTVRLVTGMISWRVARFVSTLCDRWLVCVCVLASSSRTIQVGKCRVLIYWFIYLCVCVVNVYSRDSSLGVLYPMWFGRCVNTVGKWCEVRWISYSKNQ